MSFNFPRKVIIVTGSSSGIGEDTAVNFAKSGAQVVVTGRDESRVQRVAEICKNSSPTNLEPLALIADVSKETDCLLIIKKTIEKFNRIDVLVNNAGIYVPISIGSDNLMSVYDQVFQVNVRAVLLLTKLAAPFLMKTNGVIVNVSSVEAKRASAFSTTHNMSKCAIDMLTKCACVELGPSGVRVISINPAVTETPMIEKAGMSLDSMKAQVADEYPLGRIGQVSDITSAILFAASESSNFISGSSIILDGGCLAGAPMKK